MITGSVSCGRGGAGLIGFTPEPGMLKAMVSVPVAALASRIACRREPGPLSFVLMTVKVVAAKADGSQLEWRPGNRSQPVKAIKASDTTRLRRVRDRG